MRAASSADTNHQFARDQLAATMTTRIFDLAARSPLAVVVLVRRRRDLCAGSRRGWEEEIAGHGAFLDSHAIASSILRLRSA